MSRILILFLVMVFLNSCSEKKKTQEELYLEMTSGFKYGSYKNTSDPAVQLVIKTYHDQIHGMVPLNRHYAHVLLGYMWTLSGNPAMAFAEADLAQESDQAEVKLLAQSLRSIVMYEQGWDTLARHEAQEAKKYLVDKPGSVAPYEISFFYLIMGVSYVYNQDLDQSKIYWAGFANETKISWPYQITDAISDLRSGRLQDGLGKLKLLSSDAAVPEALRFKLVDQLNLIESKRGDVNSSLFWPRLISTTIFDELKHSGNQQMASVIEMLEVLEGTWLE